MIDESQSFQGLQRLLALKRHETPPPGYFDRLPFRVMARIEAQEMANETPWWKSLLALLATPQGLRGVNALVVAGLGLIGVSLFHVATAPEDSGEVAIHSTSEIQVPTWGATRWPSAQGASELASAPNRQPGTGTNRDFSPAALFAIPSGIHSAEQRPVSFVFPDR